MSIFSKIKDAIFGKKAVAAPAPVQTAAPVAEVVAPVSAPAAIIEEVDVEAIRESPRIAFKKFFFILIIINLLS